MPDFERMEKYQQNGPIGACVTYGAKCQKIKRLMRKRCESVRSDSDFEINEELVKSQGIVAAFLTASADPLVILSSNFDVGVVGVKDFLETAEENLRKNPQGLTVVKSIDTARGSKHMYSTNCAFSEEDSKVLLRLILIALVKERKVPFHFRLGSALNFNHPLPLPENKFFSDQIFQMFERG